MNEIIKQSMISVFTFFISLILIILILFLIYKFVIVPINFGEIIKNAFINAITN